MAVIYNPFPSKYSGEEIDAGIEAALNMRNMLAHVYYPSSEVNKADLNLFLQPKVYRIDYFVNGYAEDSGRRPIDLYVQYINDTTVQQSYKDGDNNLVRTYDVPTQTFTEWEIDASGTNVVIASINEEVSVKKPTFVLRYKE